MDSALSSSLSRATRRLILVLALGVAGLSGCATTGGNPQDPLEPLNRKIYSFNEHVDELVVKPAAHAWRLLLPDFARTGISNFFSNIGDVVVALNNVLQGKLTAAGQDVSRVAVNSTIGLLGFIDVASKIGLEKHDEDFGQTLGWWGIGNGPYVVLPFFGPSTLRDTAGLAVDLKTYPLAYVEPVHDRNTLLGARVVSKRSELLGASNVLEAAALDPYAFLRDAYLQRRRALVYDGNPPREDFDDEDDVKKDEPKKDEPKKSSRRSPFLEEPVQSVLISGEPLTPAEEAARLAARSAEHGGE